ncbi:hypothetical protein BJX63DRAFT_420934 [Aspergillus granulosus]|uniref:Uncharacterized protein n=1 Tax=Aspergillus granulosus TaxID=176169 RepID=A0ABR4HF88_9EURO
MTDKFEWYLPEWGQLPAEQYLIRFWDPASPESPGEQRSRLIQQFLQLDYIDPEWDPTALGDFPERKPLRIPTPEEIANVLRPWRSDDLRIRWKIWQNKSVHPVLVRTYYNPKDDERAATWETMAEEYEPCAFWSFLNDKSTTSDYSRRTSAGDLEPYSSGFKEGLLGVKQSNQHTWKQDPNILIRDNVDGRLMLYAVSPLAYLDSKLNVVIQGRIDINDVRLSQTLRDWEMQELPIEVFEEGTLGDKYLYDGEIGRELYQWTKENLEDDPPAE